jgi:cysteine synthase
VQEIYKRKTTDMKERLEQQTTKADRTEKRRKLELEGYGADLENMKRKIEFYQKYITKLKQLVEQDQGVADLFTKLQNDDMESAMLESASKPEPRFGGMHE